MDIFSPPFVVTIVTLLGGIAAAWGSERQARRDLERRHDALAADLRPKVQTMEIRMLDIERNRLALDTKLDTKLEALSMSLSDKASKESVSNLKEDLGEIKGMINSLLIQREREPR